ncbi:MAG: hypothetical protein V4668_02570 [Patescibacteria group bacterium]
MKKNEKIIIKCENCGFKYYDGDVHKCKAFRDPTFIGVVNVEEKEKEERKETTDIKEKKETTKTRKKPFKLKW